MLARILTLLLISFWHAFLAQAGITDHLLAQSTDEKVTIYSAPPSDFKARFEIAACYAHCQGEFLLLHRSLHTRNQPGVWGVPGGKVDSDETPADANRREFLEETQVALDPKKVRFLRTVYIRDLNDFVFHMFTYEFPDKPKITLKPLEHQAFAWKPFSEAIALPLLLGEKECFELLPQALQIL